MDDIKKSFQPILEKPPKSVGDTIASTPFPGPTPADSSCTSNSKAQIPEQTCRPLIQAHGSRSLHDGVWVGNRKGLMETLNTTAETPDQC